MHLPQQEARQEKNGGGYGISSTTKERKIYIYKKMTYPFCIVEFALGGRIWGGAPSRKRMTASIRSGHVEHAHHHRLIALEDSSLAGKVDL